jgi:hypothetical protein
MNPPKVVDVAIPRSHRTSSTTKIVYNIGVSLLTIDGRAP